MGLNDEIADTPATRQITITLRNAARESSSTTRVSVSCTCKKVLCQLSLPMIQK
ncbi:hypothetical protein L211DRAFT_834576 [Terfezia boudieri ATCC MYA-4762]|uniref:Uncharacterized protein n=1 Tax=Terfezia boudieri ATCC MYA-4762 TaxID=1051890 RepID=A0A3N4M439_9PEZI|nr:hypothetical protein L211DRAFT_834576 [Terfezia boudieri ATCC MYA-4762]